MTKLLEKIAFLLQIPILIFGTLNAIVAAASEVKFETNAVDSNENFGDCWYNANFSCMKSIALDTLKGMMKENEIKLTNSIVIEKIGNKSNEEHEKKEESRGFDLEVTQAMEEVLEFVKNHALKIDLWGFAKLRIGRSLDNPNNLEIVFDMNKGTSKGSEEGKGNKMWKIIVPLVMGFKTTAALIFGISAVKIFLLKALAVSKLAFLAASFLVLKKLVTVMGGHHQPFIYGHHAGAYYDHGLDGGLPSAYGYANYMGGHYATAGAGLHGYGASGGGGMSSGAEDLQAHFTNNVVSTVQSRAANQTSTRRDGSQHRKFSLVKSDANRVPVLTYRKHAETGRSS